MFYSSAEMQSVYSTALADWAVNRICSFDTEIKKVCAAFGKLKQRLRGSHEIS